MVGGDCKKYSPLQTGIMILNVPYLVLWLCIACVTMIEAVLSTRPSCRWPSKIRQMGATARILEHHTTEDGRSLSELVKITTLETNIDTILKVIRSDFNIQEVVPMGYHGASLFVSIRGVSCDSCRIATTAQRCFLTSTVVNEEGRMEMRIFASGKSPIRALLADLRRAKVDVYIKTILSIGRRGGLTQRQEQVSRMAVENGYFDYPRRVNLEKLAYMADASPSTISEIMRRVERKVFDHYFKVPLDKDRLIIY